MMRAAALAALTVVAMCAHAAAPDGEHARTPKWREGLPVGTWATVPGTDKLRSLLKDDGWAANIDASCGIGLDEQGNAYWLKPGGHATVPFGGWRNIDIEIRLATDMPTVELLTKSAPKSAVFDAATDKPVFPGGPRYPDGSVATRHTYYTTQPVYAKHASDGVPRMLLVTTSAAIFDGFRNEDGKYYFTTGSQVESFRLDKHEWEPPQTFPDLPESDTFYAIARDPRDGAIYAHASKALWKLDVTSRKWARLQAALPALNRHPMEVDTKRNALISVVQRKRQLFLMSADLKSGEVTYKAITGPLKPGGTQEGRGLVYDPDNDRYLYFDHRVTNTLVSWAELYAISPDGEVTDLGPLPKPWPTVATDGRPKYSAALGGVVFAPRANVSALFLPTR